MSKIITFTVIFFLIVCQLRLNIVSEVQAATQEQLQFSYIQLGDRIGAPQNGSVADFNADNRLDMLVPSSSSLSYVWGIYWIENTANGYINHRIISDRGYMQAEGARLDGDTDYDMAVVVSDLRSFGWQENTGSDTFVYHELGITTSSRTKHLEIIDLDQDGDEDIVMCANGELGIRWYENNGSGNFTANIIQASTYYDRIAVSDMDNDSDLDIIGTIGYLLTGGDHLTYWENNGSESFTQHSLLTATGTSNVGGRRMVVTDLNSDGYTDIVTVHRSIGELQWWENAHNNTFINHVLLTGLVDPENIGAGDLDKDNDTDLVLSFVSSSYTPKVVFLDNNGNESFTSWPVFTTSTTIQDIEVVDFDQDSWLDIISENWGTEDVVLHRNTGPAPDVTPPSMITNLTLVAGSFPGDLTLQWTAPGDDGSVGQASSYQIRWDVKPILSESDWSTSALPLNIPLPVPATAGSVENLQVNFTPGTMIYFAIKTCDEANNCSAISNSPGLLAPGMLIRDINETLLNDPDSIVGQQVTIAGVVARVDDWEGGIGDIVSTQESLVKFIDTMQNAFDTGWTYVNTGGVAAIAAFVKGLLFGQIVDTWSKMRSVMMIGTHSGEWGGDPTLLVWDPEGALPEAGFPYVLTGIIREKQFLYFDQQDHFYYLDVTDSVNMTKIIPSATELHYTIPPGYTFLNSMDISLNMTVPGSKVCGIGMVNERYPKNDRGYLQTTLLQRDVYLDAPPVLIRVDKEENQPQIGALILFCGTKSNLFAEWNLWSVQGYLDTLVDEGGITLLAGYKQPLTQHETLGNGGIFLHAGSPVDLHITDSLGHHVGAIYSQSGEVTGIGSEIPGSYYFYGIGEYPEFIYIPKPIGGEYMITLQGTGNGTYTQTITLTEPNGMQTFFEQQSDQPITMGELVVNDFNELPSAPRGLALTNMAGEISLNWLDNTEIDLLGYYVYRQQSTGGAIVRLNEMPVNESQFSDILSDDKDYLYWVTAVDTDYNESGAAIVRATHYDNYLPLTLRP